MSLEKEEFTGKDVNYYLVEVKDPKRLEPYTAECEDIIEALGMTFSEGCEFKALWRSCAARTLGKHKQGSDKHGVYDAEKQVYYAQRTLAQRIKGREKVIPIVTIVPKFPPPGFPSLDKKEPLCINIFRSRACGATHLLHLLCNKTMDDCKKFGCERNFST